MPIYLNFELIVVKLSNPTFDEYDFLNQKLFVSLKLLKAIIFGKNNGTIKEFLFH